MGLGAGGEARAFFILAESPGALSCQGPLEPGMSPPLCPATLSSALQEVHPASATAPVPPSQALLLCVRQLRGAQWETAPSSSPHSVGAAAACAQTGAGVPPTAPAVPFCQMWEGTVVWR